MAANATMAAGGDRAADPGPDPVGAARRAILVPPEIRPHLGGHPRAHRRGHRRHGNADPTFATDWSAYILGGAGLTILISAVSITLATILAIIGALGRLSRNGFINGAASLYVSLVRGTPLLVQILFVFFALPQMGIILDPIPAGIVALAFNYGAYMTEIFRAGIQAVPRGQREAAEALGHARATGHAPDRPAPGRPDRRRRPSATTSCR